MRYIISFLSIIFFVACKNAPSVYWKPYDETAELHANQTHENPRMQFRLIQSKLLDKNEIWAPFETALNRFGNDTYQALKPLIIEQDIPTLQAQIQRGLLTYEQLVLFYLYRIRKFESNPNATLHAILALNPKVIEQAMEKDRQQQKNQHPIYGMPILLKDNINTQEMPTTAGAAYLQDHTTEKDAFVVSQLGLGLSIVFLLGLIAAAYSSADSALTSLTTSISIDLLDIEKRLQTSQQEYTRKKVHLMVSVVLILVILSFNYLISDKSVIAKLFVFAGYTYGPLLGLYALGVLTKVQLRDRWVPWVAVSTPIAGYWISQWTLQAYNFDFGFFILALNGALCFFGLLLIRSKGARPI